MKFTKIGIGLGVLIFLLDVGPVIISSSGGKSVWGPGIGVFIIYAIQLLAFPFYIASTILFLFSDNWGVWSYSILKFAIGLSFFVLADFVNNYGNNLVKNVDKITSH